MSEYPKLLFKAGQEITVGSATEEAEKVAEGYAPAASDVLAVEPTADVEEPVADQPEGPTFGAPHDQTHAKRPAKVETHRDTHKKK